VDLDGLNPLLIGSLGGTAGSPMGGLSGRLNPLLIGSLGGTERGLGLIKTRRLNPLLIGSLGGTEVHCESRPQGKVSIPF